MENPSPSVMIEGLQEQKAFAKRKGKKMSDVVGYARKNKWGSYDDQQVVLLTPGVDAKFADVYYDLREKRVYNGDNPISDADAEELFRGYPKVKKAVDDLWHNPPDRAAINLPTNGSASSGATSSHKTQPGLFQSIKEGFMEGARKAFRQARASRQRAKARAAGGTTPPPNGPRRSSGGSQTTTTTTTTSNGGGQNPPIYRQTIRNWMVLLVGVGGAVLMWILIRLSYDLFGFRLHHQALGLILAFALALLVGMAVKRRANAGAIAGGGS